MSSSLRAIGMSRSLPGGRPWARPRPVLHGIDLELPAATSVGIVGASGAGKTTVLRCLLGLEALDAGRVCFGDREVRPAPPHRLRWFRRLVQYVPQDPAGSLDARRRVRDLVAEPLRRLAVAGDHRRMVSDAMDRVELSATLADRRPTELSGGQLQRVAIARAVATRPAVLLADEPVSGLDLPVRTQVLALLDHVHRVHGTAVVLVSHDLAAVAELCDRVVVLESGRVVEDRPTASVLTDPGHPATRALLAAAPRLPHPPPSRETREP